MNLGVSLMDDWLADVWLVRWSWFLVIPLIIGSIVSLLVVPREPVRPESQSSGENHTRANTETGWVKNLTFLGAAVSAVAGLSDFTDDVTTKDDLGVLVASNVVFVALAATYPLLLGIEIPQSKRLAAATVLCSALASLTSLNVMLWRSANVPTIIQIFFTALFTGAAILVSTYVNTAQKQHDRR